MTKPVHTPQDELPSFNRLRVLCVDGGGVKGYTALTILKRILWRLSQDSGLARDLQPYEVLDFMVGTSREGLIAVMLGRLRMTIDECIHCYETVSEEMFKSSGLAQSKVSRFARGISSKSWYGIGVLQQQIRNILQRHNFGPEESLREKISPRCKV